jgi:hypothetical protein
VKNTGALESNPTQAAAIDGATPWSGWRDNLGASARWFAWLRRVFSGAPARLALGVFVLTGLVVMVYLPLLPGSFVMDDARLVGEQANPLVNGQLGLVPNGFPADPLRLVG